MHGLQIRTVRHCHDAAKRYQNCCCRRQYCSYRLAKCIRLVINIDSSSKRTRLHTDPVHEERIDARFLAFDDYMASMNVSSFLTYPRTTIEEFEELIRRLAPKLERNRRHRAVISPRHRLSSVSPSYFYQKTVTKIFLVDTSAMEFLSPVWRNICKLGKQQLLLLFMNAAAF